MLLAAERLADGDPRVASSLRPDQIEVFEAFTDYLCELACGLETQRWAHVVLPPRTGKTVLAAQMVQASGLHSAFIVPTKVLVAQVLEQVARWAPHVPTGVFFGERKELVPYGLNVITYSSLTQHGARLPAELRSADVVFVDEAHHAMSGKRRRALRGSFSGDAVRLGLTATPDYDEVRRLDRLFPRRLVRQELRHALASGLLAPAHVHIAEVDVDASAVEIVAGDYRADHISRVLGEAPFMEAALRFRYASTHRGRPCMLACTSRQQAYALRRFLRARRPPGTSAPGLLLGETRPDERARILRAFERGRIDTLIQVGVLIEGWSSPRCKLLIDLAPGRSRVRATQKYFRVLTRDGQRHAHIVVLVPRQLRRPPVLPTDLLLQPGEEYRCGQEVGASGARKACAELPPVRSVRLTQRVVVSARLGLPRLQRNDREGLLAVLSSCEELSPEAIPGRQTFERLYFSHPLFSGTGRALLQWLGISRRAGAYDSWLARLFPEQAAARWLGEGWVLAEDQIEIPAAAREAPLDPERLLLRREWARRLSELVGGLKGRDRQAVEWRFGLSGDDPPTYVSMGRAWGLSRERTRQLTRTAVGKLRQALLEQEQEVPMGRGRDSDLILRLGGREPTPWKRPRDPVAFVSARIRALADEQLHELVRGEPCQLTPWAHRELARRMERRGDLESARTHRMQLQRWRQPEVLQQMGEDLHARGRYREALEAFREAKAPYWWKADCWLRLGELDDAVHGWWPWDNNGPPDHYHRLLATHLQKRPWSRYFTIAIALHRRIGEGLLDPARGAQPRRLDLYLRRTHDLWLGSQGACERLAFWLEAPELRDWSERWQLLLAGSQWDWRLGLRTDALKRDFADVVREVRRRDPWDPAWRRS